VVENRVEWRLAPHRADDGAEDGAIHSNATRLLPNPTLPNTAKAMRMAMRRKKRTSTWIDLSSCGQVGELRQGCKLFYILRVLTGTAALPLDRFR